MKSFSAIVAVVAAAAGCAPAQTAGSAPTLTAKEVIERIQKNVGVPWRTETVDTFKAGDPNTKVTGVATTMMATMEVLQKAAASGKNLIITHEPTFYSHLDGTESLANDPVFKAKMDFIREHNLVVWRFHDHWHMHRPDGILHGMAAKVDWLKYQDPNDPLKFNLPAITLGDLTKQLKSRLHAGTIRVIGSPDLKITRVAFIPGAAPNTMQEKALSRPDIDAVVIGEAREWETVEYAADSVTEGNRKALIVLGHVVSEQAGMEECAQWLKGFVKEVPVEFIPASEPFWAVK